jgi:hypothetical protein
MINPTTMFWYNKPNNNVDTINPTTIVVVGFIVSTLFLGLLYHNIVVGFIVPEHCCWVYCPEHCCWQ